MGQQRRLHLRPRDVIASADDHIIRPRRKVKAARLILPETVPRQVPALPHIFALPRVIQIPAPRRPPHHQPPDLAARQFHHILVHDPRDIPRHRPPGAARMMVIKPVGQENMQHLGRADPVQHRLAGPRPPLLINRRRQRLPRTDRRPKAGQIRPLLHRLQHGAVGGGGGETHRRPMFLNKRHHVGRARLLQQRRRRAKPQRKDRQAPQTEGKRQRRRPHKHILRRHLQHLGRIAIRNDQQVPVEMHRRLRLPGGAGCKAQ